MNSLINQYWAQDSRFIIVALVQNKSFGKNMTLYTERAIILYLKYIQNYYFETYILLSNIYRITHMDVNFGTFTRFCDFSLFKVPE